MSDFMISSRKFEVMALHRSFGRKRMKVLAGDPVGAGLSPNVSVTTGTPLRPKPKTRAPSSKRRTNPARCKSGPPIVDFPEQTGAFTNVSGKQKFLVKPSLIPRAGKGLFTIRQIRNLETVGWYWGKTLTEKQAHESKSEYIGELEIDGKRSYIDANARCLVGYINETFAHVAGIYDDNLLITL